MKARILINFILIFIIIEFSGCNRSKNIENKTTLTESGNNSKIKLKWLAQWYGEGKKETLLNEIAREFSLLHQNIEIDMEFPHQMAKIAPEDPSTSAYTIDTIVNMALKNEWPYDFMLCDAYIYESVGKKLNDFEWGNKFLVNFKVESWYMQAHKDNFFSSNTYTEVYRGLAPGTYIEGVWNILYLSSEVENRLGLKVKKINMNLTDFTAYAKTVYEYNLNHTDKITFFTYPWDYVVKFFNHIAMSSLGKDHADNREEAIESLKKIYQAVEKLSIYKPLEQYVINKNERDFHYDKTLFIYYPSWINMFWQKSNPAGEKLMHPCEIPSLNDKKSTSYSGSYNSVFVVPKNAKNRKEAELLMRFISSPETADKWIKYSKCPTGLKNRISYSDFGTDEYAKFSNHIKQKYQDRLLMVNLNETFFNTTKAIDFHVVALMKGEMSADEALNSVLKQINSE